uniref:Phd zn-finger protein n=1 Tax=Melanopsichium pennsylvanicum 4 TaxID=1398559 RepID=A0A077R0W5_9BASI|nr:phd zn-finger protein [Melanopsichium pennsylvanicum 4]
MTPTGLISTKTSSLPPNWFELAVKSKAAELREAHRKMSTTSSLPTEIQSEEQVASSSTCPQSAPAQDADQEMPAIKSEPIQQPLSRADAQLAAKSEATSSSAPLAGGLVSAQISAAPEAPAAGICAAVSTVQQQPMESAAPSLASTSSNPSLEGDALRTEVMGPPPTLPADPAYPPLNPVVTDVWVHAPAPKRRGPNTLANGTHKKAPPTVAPADFTPPTNRNGKMPYALFQTIKKVPADAAKSSGISVRSQSESTTLGDAPSLPKQGEARADASVSVECNAVDPLLADVLTDAESVATATATRETSPDASIVQDSRAEIPTGASGSAQAPSMVQPAPIPSNTTLLNIASSTPAAVPSAVEWVDASPSASMRRSPSNRSASVQASQSITNAYADPMGLKKHRESLLQDAARDSRSPSVSSAGAGPASTTTATAAGGKKSSVARTIVPPPMVEPPHGMMYTIDGKLRTIPGIAGAIISTGFGSTLTNTNFTPRHEDKSGANNDFCETCGGHGRFVCCDGCPRSFHFHCMSPPLDIDEMPPSNAVEVLGPPRAGAAQKGKGKASTSGTSADLNLDEMWFCNVCVAERKPKAVSKPKGLGPFGYLLPVLEQHNPKSFQLPADVRTYFKDVATANDGDYVNGGMLRQVKPNKHGQIEARDPYRLKDKNGDAVLCYCCGGTALPSASERSAPGSRIISKAPIASAPADHTICEGTGWRKTVSCDFCPLHWHIDCVDPPMLGMPSNLRRWMCPAHSDHVNDRRRIPRVGTAVPKVLDLPMPSTKTIGPRKHFRTRVLNNGDIDIIPDPMEELMGANGITGSLQSGVKEIIVVPGVIDAPSLTAGGSKLASKIKYRFPEKVIRTDFWSKLRADEAASIGSVFYIAADEIVHKTPTRLVAMQDGVSPTESRYRPFGQRQYPLSGLDALADIATTRLSTDHLVSHESEDLAFKIPSRTRQLVATALGIDLTNEDVPESNLRSNLDFRESSSDDSSSELSSLSETPESSPSIPAFAPESTPAPAPAPELVAPAAQTSAVQHNGTLSEEELIKQIAREAATGVSSGDPIRLSKRKAAVAAESAIAGSPNTPNKKLRSASPANVALTPAPKVATVPLEIKSKKISLKAILNGTGSKGKEKVNDKVMDKGLNESQVALRTAYHLAEQFAEERKEIEQLRAIKELMQLKGQRRLLEFLLSPNGDEPESSS